MAKENNFDKIVPHDIFISGDLKVLICYMLTSLNEAVPITETAQLFHYEGIANYFDTQTAIYELEKEGYIVRNENNTDMIFVTEKGTFLSDTLKDSVSLILRDKVYTAVVKMLTRYKAERDTDIEITRSFIQSYASEYVTSNGTQRADYKKSQILLRLPYKSAYRKYTVRRKKRGLNYVKTYWS